MINLRTGLLPHQQAAFDKLKGLKIGALYMEMSLKIILSKICYW